jgi:6-phosphogluconolactonase (cycloisomerase 2 family)
MVPSVAIHPTGKFVYVGNEISSDVSAYTIDPITGTLTSVPGSPFSLSVVRLAVDPLGRFLFGVGADVKVFKIDPITGALALISSFPAVVGTFSVAVDPSGKFVYAASVQSGSVSAYSIDVTTGVLTPVAGSPFPGTLSAFSVTVDPAGKFVYVANAIPSDSISAYAINPSTGALTAVVGSPFGTQGCPVVSVAVDSSGKFVYAAASACGSNNVLGYTIDPLSGALRPLAGSPFPGGPQPLSITIK